MPNIGGNSKFYSNYMADHNIRGEQNTFENRKPLIHEYNSSIK